MCLGGGLGVYMLEEGPCDCVSHSSEGAPDKGWRACSTLRMLQRTTSGVWLFPEHALYALLWLYLSILVFDSCIIR